MGKNKKDVFLKGTPPVAVKSKPLTTHHDEHNVNAILNSEFQVNILFLAAFTKRIDHAVSSFQVKHPIF